MLELDMIFSERRLLAVVSAGRYLATAQ